MGDTLHSKSPSESLPPDNPGRRIAGGLAVFLLLLIVLYWTSAELGTPPRDDAAVVTKANANGNANGNANATASADDNSPAEKTRNSPPPDSADAEPPAKPDDPLHAHVEIDTLVDLQPSWLKIIGTTSMGHRAVADGRFAQHNEFTIETNNVDAFQIHLKNLPVLRGQQVIMHIDKQNLALHIKEQAKLTFSRSPAGSWFVISD